MMISKHFSLEEFEFSETATRWGYDNSVPSELIPNAADLAQAILDPLREHLGRPVVISSGFRSPWLNRKVKGARGSQHMKAQAADIVVAGIRPVDICATIEWLGLPFDQLLNEFGKWTHVSYSDRHRREVLTIAYDHNDELQTVAGLVPVINGRFT